MAGFEAYPSLRTYGRAGNMSDMPARERRVVLVGFQDMQLIDIVGPAEVFDAASRTLGGSAGYRVVVATRDGRPVRGAAGLRIGADIALSHVRARGLDTLIVGGGMAFEEAVADAHLL